MSGNGLAEELSSLLRAFDGSLPAEHLNALNRFLRHLVHDLNNPLSTLSMELASIAAFVRTESTQQQSGPPDWTQVQAISENLARAVRELIDIAEGIDVVTAPQNASPGVLGTDR